MIKNKIELQQYVEADMLANFASEKHRKSLLACRWDGMYNLLYLHYLRRTEYVLTCCKGYKRKVLYSCLSRRLRKIGVLTGIYIPPFTFGKGLFIPHWGSIVVNDTARFGENCVVQSCVNISEGVVGGNHIYLSAGAKIMIDVHLDDDVIVGANAVVTKSVTEPNVVVAGVPAKIISRKGFKNREKV